MTKYLDRRWIDNGQGLLLRRGQTSRTQGTNPTPPPTTDVPNGYVLAKKWDLTKDEGWYKHTGHTNNAAYFTPSNITFGPTGMRIRCTHESVGGYNWTSGEARWANGVGVVPDEFYMRYTGYMEQPLLLGDFPAWPWFRPQTGDGNGEIDTWETFANHIAGVAGATQTSLPAGQKATMIKTPYGSNQVNYGINFVESKVGATRLNFVEQPKTFEIYKTLTDMTIYVNGVLMTHHVRGSGGMSAADWDSQFAAGKLWDIRISYQYGDDPDGQPSGEAGTPQVFSGNRYLNMSELLYAVPA